MAEVVSIHYRPSSSYPMMSACASTSLSKNLTVTEGRKRMSSPQDEEEEDNKDVEKEEEEDGDHLPAP